jgi:hypothetical protein
VSELLAVGVNLVPTSAWEYIALANATRALCPPDSVIPFSPISTSGHYNERLVSDEGKTTDLSDPRIQKFRGHAPTCMPL